MLHIHFLSPFYKLDTYSGYRFVVFAHKKVSYARCLLATFCH